MKGINLNYVFLYLILVLIVGCGAGFKIIYKGKNAEGFDRATNTRCELLWTSFKENGVIEDVYGEPCNTVIQYRDK